MSSNTDIAIELSDDDMQAHQEMVDQLNQEYADSITPEYIAEQHSKQRNLLITSIDLCVND